MVPIRMLIPHTYCSILLAAEPVGTSSLANAENLYQPEPICVPDTFAEAEKRYIEKAAQDPVLWLIHGNESTLVCESEILSDKERLEGELHRYCYESYDISSLTVQKHIQNLLRKLEVSSRLELFKEYRE